MTDQSGSSTTGPSSDITSDDRLFAALAYVFSPLSSILLLLVEDKKNRPFIRFHAIQSIAAGIALGVIAIILAIVSFGILSCLVPFFWLPMLYWAYKSYQGEYVNIPLISDFVKKQGW